MLLRARVGIALVPLAPLSSRRLSPGSMARQMQASQGVLPIRDHICSVCTRRRRRPSVHGEEWIAGTSPAMTKEGVGQNWDSHQYPSVRERPQSSPMILVAVPSFRARINSDCMP